MRPHEPIPGPPAVRLAHDSKLPAITITLPLRLVSLVNHGGDRFKMAKRAKEHRGVTRLALRSACAGWRMCFSPHWPNSSDLRVRVTVTRMSLRRFDSHDNLPISAKNVVDGIADALGVKDNDPRLDWQYAQETWNGHAVRIQIERVGA